MPFVSDREKRLWWSAGLCLLLIYSTLYIVRPVVTYLRERNLVRLSVATAFLLVAVWVVRFFIRQRVGWRTVAGLAAVSAFYTIVLLSVDALPEELVHFLEYGLVALLFDAALRERKRNLPASSGFRASSYPGITAALLTIAAGWLDEGIQLVLPNRFYGFRDVVFNGLGGIFALLSARLLFWCSRVDQEGRRAA